MVTLLGRKRKVGRKPVAAPAWEHQPFEINTPPAHPEQNARIFAGLIQPELLVADGAIALNDNYIQEILFQHGNCTIPWKNM